MRNELKKGRKDGIEFHVIISSQTKGGKVKHRAVRRFIPIHGGDTGRAIIIFENIGGKSAYVHVT